MTLRIETRWPECPEFRALLSNWTHARGMKRECYYLTMLLHAEWHKCAVIREAEALPKVERAGVESNE